MSDTAQWAALAGAVGTALGGLITGIIVAYFKYGGEYRVKIMNAQAKLNEKTIAEQQEVIHEKNAAITSLTARVVALEDALEKIRQQGHDERNKWFETQLKYQMESAARDLATQREASECKGKYDVLQHQFDRLYERLYPDAPAEPISVRVENTPEHPVPVKQDKKL